MTGRKSWLKQFADAKELAEYYALQKIEPTGFYRLELYLAQILAALKAEPGKKYNWTEQLIGHKKKQQTPQESLAVLEQIESQQNGVDPKP